MKTNAALVLDRLGIKYELRAYEVDPDDLSAGTVAAKVGLPAEQLFKTLAVRSDRNEIYLAVISANEELDFKALAQLAGNRQLRLYPDLAQTLSHSSRGLWHGAANFSASPNVPGSDLDFFQRKHVDLTWNK